MSGHYDEDHGYVPGTPRLRPLLAAKEAAIRADERRRVLDELVAELDVRFMLSDLEFRAAVWQAIRVLRREGEQ